MRIHHGGVNGRVCHAYWDDRDARVACRQLGFPTGQAYRLDVPSASVGPVLMTEVHCQGSESSIFDCPVGNATCSGPNVMADGAICFRDELPQVQLVGGDSDNEGRVEIEYAGTSGTVCLHDNQRDQAATVACRSLGYELGTPKNVPGGTGRVALIEPSCDPADSSLLGCRHHGFLAPPTSAFCSNHDHDLGVTCRHEAELSNVFHTTNSSVAGIVRLYRNGQWLHVCGGDSFGEEEAGVVCRKQGYGFHRVLPAGALGTFRFSSPGTVGDLNCTGSERSLGDCPMSVGVCDDTVGSDYATIQCSKEPIVQGLQAVRPTTQPGEVLVQVDGLQSFVCSDQWDDDAAKVYCRDLGFGTGRAFGSVPDSGNVLRVVSSLSCRGSESSLGSCVADVSSRPPRIDVQSFETETESSDDERNYGGVQIS
ncbi:scavenger receptor cysteine-rich domain superfamily protein-like [Babylonia areolata]|uniref:scavenger receptor cysteine-rich domain superfamily protein-like n=1 Tax=Babylonia areolata TaxID=304850 RepID=UPI003FD1F1FA